MSIADAVRARELEARVAELEQRVAVLEQGHGANLSQRMNLMQGQINALRYRGVADSVKIADPVKNDDAA